MRGTPRGNARPGAVERWRRALIASRRAKADLEVDRVWLVLVERGAPCGAADIWSDARKRWGNSALRSAAIFAALKSLETDGRITSRWHADGRRKYEVQS